LSIANAQGQGQAAAKATSFAVNFGGMDPSQSLIIVITGLQGCIPAQGLPGCEACSACMHAQLYELHGSHLLPCT
jgi:hypothetical protein